MTQQLASAKDEIRSAFFAKKIKTKIITLESGHQVEIRQPRVGAQLDIAEAKDTKQRMVRMLVEHCYVPGTEEKVFDEADFNSILNAPAGGDYEVMIAALHDLMLVKEAVKEQGKS